MFCVHLFEKGGKTALMYAAEGGKKDVVQVLLNADAAVNTVVSDETALVLAIKGGHVEVVDLLLKANAAFNVQNKVLHKYIDWF